MQRMNKKYKKNKGDATRIELFEMKTTSREAGITE